jgi:hypothetical protein
MQRGQREQRGAEQREAFSPEQACCHQIDERRVERGDDDGRHPNRRVARADDRPQERREIHRQR